MDHKKFTASLELKNVNSEAGTFEGYASVFGVEDSDGDVINKGAFVNTIKAHKDNGSMPKMLWQHNPSIVIGKFVDMFEDERGLFVKGQLIVEVDKGREALALMKAGAIDAMSVGFNIADATQRKGTGRDINETDLWEVSIVTWGANPEALVSSVKSIDTTRNFERFLRDSGFSKKEAVNIASNGFKAKNRSDSDSEMKDSLSNLIKSMRA